MKRKAILLLLSICMTCSALVGCSDNSSTESNEEPLETSNVELTESTGADEEDSSSIYNYLEFLDEFSTQDIYGKYHYYFVVQNISDTDIFNLTIYGNAYDADGKNLGLAHGSYPSLSPNDKGIVHMTLTDANKYIEFDRVDIVPEEFIMADSANTKYSVDNSKIEYSSTLNQDEKRVYITVTNNSTENVDIYGVVVFYKDGVPVDVLSSLVHSMELTTGDDGLNELFIKPGETIESSYFSTVVDFDDYELYISPYADF